MTENQRLKEVRKALGLNQRNFSDTLGMKQGSYSDVERGKTGISAVIIKSLITKFRVDPLWLCEGRGSMFIGDIDPKKRTHYSYDLDESFPIDEDDENSPSKLQIDSLTAHLEKQRQYLESMKSMLDLINDN
jgi:transcriptional regulator with XRE-family HTH domain